MSNELQRIKKVRKILMEWDSLPFLVTDLVNIRYLTGFHGTNGTLLLGEKRNYFFTDSRYEEYAKSIIPSSLTFKLQKKGLFLQVSELLPEGSILHIEDHHVPFGTYNELRKVMRKKKVKVKGGGSPVNEVRMVKDSDEIAILQEAAEITDSCVEHLVSYIKPGMTEWQIDMEIERYYKSNGCTGTSFPSIVASGRGSSMPHYETSMTKEIARGDVLMIDMGCVYKGYNSDLTRTFAVDRVPEHIEEIYSVVQKAQQAAVDSIRPGMTTGEADAVARDIIEECGFGEEFGHSLGHGYGLEVHELPAVRMNGEVKLETNMTVTVEPGIYLPGIGGVRIEDMVLIGSPNRALTTYPKDLQII